MATLAKYIVKLEAQTAKYQRDLERANGKLERFNKKNTKALSGLKKAFGGLAAFVSVRFFAGYIKSSLEATDKLGKLVDRLGGTTEAFSELKLVAELSGIEFNQMAMGLQRMSRRIAEAAVGTGEAKGALKELGLEAKTLGQLEIDQQFEALADALFNVEGASDKTRLAMKLFDSEGVTLLQTMTKGAAGIREMRAEAKKLGVSFSIDQVDAATRANDAMTRLGATFAALGTNIAISLTPAIEAVTAAFIEMITGPGAAGLGAEIAEVTRLIALQRAEVEKGGFDFTFGNAQTNLERLEQRLDGLLIRQGNLIDPPGGKGNAIADRYDAAAETAAALLLQQEKVNEAVAKFNEEFKLDQRYKAALENINDVSDELDDVLDAQTDKLEAAQEAAADLGFTFASAFEDAIVNGEKLSSVLQGLAQDILRIIVRRSITEPLGNFVSGLFGGPKAAGGPVNAGTSYLVGEQGPELFTPQTSGTIIPNGAGGGVSIINNIDARGADEARIMRIMPMIMERTKQETIAAIMDRQATGRM